MRCALAGICGHAALLLRLDTAFRKSADHIRNTDIIHRSP